MYIFFTISLALFIRLYHHHHILMSDEANNMLTIKAIIEGDGLREYFFKHPPLFTIFSAIVSYPFGDKHLFVQGISIVFSVLSMVPFYLIVERVFDKKTAILSSLFLAVLPVNIIYSTWVKQDAMLLFFFLCALYLYITDRPYKSGIMFGIASLTKEFALFLIPIVFGWEMLRGWKGGESFKRLIFWLFVGIAISGWWYLAYGGKSYKAIGAAVAGGNLFEFSWHYPWYYYIRNLIADLTLALIPFFLIGLICLIGLRGAAGVGLKFAPVIRDPKLLPVLWFLSFYLPLSLMTVKAPWYAYLASPAMATIVAVGFLKAWDLASRKWLRLGGLLVITTLVMLNTYTLRPTWYYEWLIAAKPRKLPVFYEREYLSTGRETLKGEKRVALLEYNPTLQYYLGIPDRRLFYLGSQFPAMSRDRMKDLAERFDIGWFAMDTDSLNYTDNNVTDLTSLFGEPKRVGNVLIFKVSKGNIP